ncbi:hypothetical protein M405DRAFT_821439 [Rhizopogon salebrosus TDB-379]|nr:hypothetical protein M405DRAFT_821439 [Rhizopogon salebrosus TDB-379]
MAGMAAISNLRKFSSGGYRYPDCANLLYKICCKLQPSPMTGQSHTVSMTQRQGSVRLGEG